MSAAPMTLVPSFAMRVALFLGNYNCVRDAVNSASNDLVKHLLGEGDAVHIYSRSAPASAFPPVRDLVLAPSIAIPWRPEYRLVKGMSCEPLEELRSFNPTLVHVSASDILRFSAQKYASHRRLPIFACLYSRFDKYVGYCRLNFLRSLVERLLDCYYRQSDRVLLQTDAIRRESRDLSINANSRLLERDMDSNVFDPENARRRARRFTIETSAPAYLDLFKATKRLKPVAPDARDQLIHYTEEAVRT